MDQEDQTESDAEIFRSTVFQLGLLEQNTIDGGLNSRHLFIEEGGSLTWRHQHGSWQISSWLTEDCLPAGSSRGGEKLVLCLASPYRALIPSRGPHPHDLITVQKSDTPVTLRVAFNMWLLGAPNLWSISHSQSRTSRFYASKRFHKLKPKTWRKLAFLISIWPEDL